MRFDVLIFVGVFSLVFNLLSGHMFCSSSIWLFGFFHFSCFCLAQSYLSMTYFPLGKLKKGKNKQIKESEADESPSASRQKQNKTGCLPPELGFGTRAKNLKHVGKSSLIKSAWECFIFLSGGFPHIPTWELPSITTALVQV